MPVKPTNEKTSEKWSIQVDKNGKSDRKFFGLSPSYPVELFLSKRMSNIFTTTPMRKCARMPENSKESSIQFYLPRSGKVMQNCGSKKKE